MEIPQSASSSSRIVFPLHLRGGLITKWSAVTVPLCPSPLRLPLDTQTTQRQPGLTWMPLYGSGGEGRELAGASCSPLQGLCWRRKVTFSLHHRGETHALGAVEGRVGWRLGSGCRLRRSRQARFAGVVTAVLTRQRVTLGTLHASFTGCPPPPHKVTARVTYVAQWIIRRGDEVLKTCTAAVSSQRRLLVYLGNKKKTRESWYHRPI